MERETQNKFFCALVVNERFREGVLNTETRMKTIESGYQGEKFELDENDKKVMRLIGKVENPAEFTQKYFEHLGQIDTSFSTRNK